MHMRNLVTAYYISKSNHFSQSSLRHNVRQISLVFPTLADYAFATLRCLSTHAATVIVESAT
ncbi:uncharacterized protein LACBIDRAFT_318145 [Laccaria bicolor S238N-H82]|uniref:Predicted protein n=1 Tax=Laccaria bicolor (strain S238N-H82 / ATCC MYA-4686) TaxID=486041 RepID=B0D637_LACBS|nr:uncharacterized protein LACBIDRAFT_318145 [Laccaria bicolor S238N-H82]EDR10132.1 predicted protein [Laccaria bicolor S238N-H82]|eukprot:XP_001879517.1 predicted protein [Laccaria bicolor S238N-H82]